MSNDYTNGKKVTLNLNFTCIIGTFNTYPGSNLDLYGFLKLRILSNTKTKQEITLWSADSNHSISIGKSDNVNICEETFTINNDEFIQIIGSIKQKNTFSSNNVLYDNNFCIHYTDIDSSFKKVETGYDNNDQQCIFATFTIPNCVKLTPAIFYSPHADDEAIGMAAGIAEHKAAGRPVYVVLISSGHNEALLNILNGKNKDGNIVKCPLHNRPGWKGHEEYHNFNITPDGLDDLRTKEFISSATALGADKIFIGKDNKTIHDSYFYSNYADAVKQVKEIILEFATKYPGSSHKFVSGSRDKFPPINITHKAIYEAALQCYLENPHLNDFRFYRVYSYWNSDNILYSHPDFTYYNENE